MTSIIIIIECIAIVVLDVKIKKNGLNQFFEIRSYTDISKVFFLLWILPVVLILRLFIQKNKNLSSILFIIQNTYLFFFFIVSEVNIQAEYFRIYWFGLGMNLIFYYADKFIFDFIENEYGSGSTDVNE
jgi:hypothetical protein